MVRRPIMRGLRTILRRFGHFLRLLMSPRSLLCTLMLMQTSFPSESESLSAVMIRIDQAMQQIHNFCPPVFSIADLNDELQSMAMITSFPSEYDAFWSSIMLLDQIDKKTLQEAFRNEEINRLCSQGDNSFLVSSKALAVATPTPPPTVSCE